MDGQFCGFNGCDSCSVASFFSFECGYVRILGNTVRFLATDRITGDQAVSKISTILGSPQQFADNMKLSTQDFIADHFGAMAIACAFGIAIRMRS